MSAALPAAPPPAPSPAPARRLPEGLRAFRHRDYRLFWGSQLFSLTGNWMQGLAQSWLVLGLTGSALHLGLINVCQFGPSLLLGLPGGVAADRFPKRRLLLATQGAYALLTAALAAQVAMGRVELWQIYAVALGLGVVNAVDMPTRQAFVADLVGTADVGNAVALNSALFNASRIVGPALAGLLLSTVGTALCFVLNAASYLPVLAALLLVRTEGAPAAAAAGESVAARLRQGLAYVAATPAVLLPIALVGSVATFGMNFNVWVPLLAKDELAIGAGGFGLLMSSLGVGSFAGAITLAFVGRRLARTAMLLTAMAFGAAEVALALAAGWSGPLQLVVLLMAAIGFAMSTTMAMANTTVQTTAPDALRGRVMSIYVTVFAGTVPIGAAVAGGIAAAAGAPVAVAFGGAVVLLSAVALAAWNAKLHPASVPAPGMPSARVPAPAGRGRR